MLVSCSANSPANDPNDSTLETAIYPKQPDEQYGFDIHTDSQSDNREMKVILEKEADLDMDGENDIISVTKPKEHDVRDFDLEISVYRMVNGEAFLWQQNALMFKDPINGCMMDGLEDITLSEDGFTVEYTSCYDNKYALRFVGFSYDPQSDDFKVTQNTIGFFNPKSNEKNQTFDCKDNNYLFSSYDGDCEWF